METIKNIILSGAVINFFAVIIGAAIGLVFKKGIPEKIKNAIMTGMALCVLLIGIDGIMNDANKILVIIISIALGAVVGELIDLDKWVNLLGQRLEKGMKKHNDNAQVAEGFVGATLLFCVGAMTIVGSIESGIGGSNITLYSKSVIDCFSAITLASTLGLGVIFSSFSVLIIQGSITLLAGYIQPLLTADITTQMSTIGSLLIVALSLNMLGLTKIKVMNFVPAIFLPLLLCQFM